MFRGTNASLAELDLECFRPRSDQWGDKASSKIRQAGLDRKMLHRMLEEAGAERISP
jgi:hypothetical protein